MYTKRCKEKNNKLSDVAMGKTLDLLKQKGEEYDIPVIAIKPIEQSTRFEYGNGHDKTVNMAKNILDVAKKENDKK